MAAVTIRNIRKMYGDIELIPGLVADFCAVSRDRQDFVPGGEVHLVPVAERIHLFDQETGRVIAP